MQIQEQEVMRRYDYSDEVTYNEYEDEYTQHNPPLVIPRRYDISDIIDFPDDYEWQVTYKFTDEFRNNEFPNGIYCAYNMTFRRLYVILCERFNEGNFFIEEYIENDYPESYVKEEADDYLEQINEMLEKEYNEIASNARITKEGNIDKRYTRTLKALSEFQLFLDAEVKDAGDYLAELVRQDIIRCLATGMVSLSKQSIADETMKKRLRLGFPTDTVFYASGQLINNLKIYFRLKKKGF